MFTQLDKLDSKYLEEWISEENNTLIKQQVKNCKDIYVGIENHSETSHTKFRENFLECLNKIIERNNQKFYTIEQFQSSQMSLSENRKKSERLDELAKEAAEKAKHAYALRAAIAAYRPPTKKRPWWKF